MNSKSKLFKKICTSVAVFITSLISMVYVVNAIDLNDLNSKAKQNTWWTLNPSDYIGQKLIQTTDPLTTNAYCVSSEGTGGTTVTAWSDSNKYANTRKIVNIIDVDTNSNGTPGTVTVYGENNKKGQTYYVNDKNLSASKKQGVQSALKLANIMHAVSKNGLNATTTTAIQIGFFQNYKNLYNIGLSKLMDPQYYYTNSTNSVLKDSEQYSQTISNYKFKTYNIIEDKLTVEQKNGKTYIGPYSMEFSGCKVEKFSVVDEKNKATETKKVATSIGGATFDASTLTNKQQFYIVVDKELDFVNKIVVKSNTLKVKKARMMFLVGEGRVQNYTVFKAEDYSKTVEVELPTVKYGSLQIHKKDADNQDINLQGIEFKVYNWSKKQWVTIDGNGKVNCNGKNVNEAQVFTTNKNGYADTAQGLPKDKNGNPIIKNLPLGKYIIYETKIPESLSEQYEITGTVTVNNGEKITAKKIKTSSTADNGIIEIGNGKTITVEATNKKAFTSLRIQKTDENGKLLTGIGFKIYSNSKKAWLKIENNKVVDFVEFDKATEIYTINGLTPEIKAVPLGKYMIIETNLGPYKDIYELGTFRYNGASIEGKIIAKNLEVTSTTGVVTFSYKNEDYYGRLKIRKIDKETKKPLAGVEFKIYSQQHNGWLKVDSSNRVIDYVSFSEASTFVTKEDGTTDDIIKVPIYKQNSKEKAVYSVYETNLPESLQDIYYIGNTNVPGEKDPQQAKFIENITVNKMATEAELTNEIYFGKLKIRKIDVDTKEPLAGIEFKIYSKKEEGWLKVDKDNRVIDYVSFDEASTFVTKADGTTDEIIKVPLYNNGESKEKAIYSVYETNLPVELQDTYKIDNIKVPGEKEPQQAKFIGDINANEIAEETELTNKIYYGKLKIRKVDEDTNIPLEGVEFKIYSQEEKGWLKVDKDNRVIDYVSFDEASTFVTKADGTTDEIIKVPLYKEDSEEQRVYSVYETGLPEQLQKIYRFEEIDVPGENEPKQAKFIQDIYANRTGEETQLTNKQEYIGLSGYVWQDIATADNKTEQTRNDIKDDADYLINGIKVVLKDRSGNIVTNGFGELCETTTSQVDGKNGFYRFEKLEIEKLSEYYVEFTYDGITYQNVVPNIKLDAGSKATESEKDRNQFNNSFNNIDGRNSITLNGEEVELKYNKEVTGEGENAQISVTLKNSFNRDIDENNKLVTINKNEDGGYTSFPINATTTSADFSIKTKYEQLKESSKEIIYEIPNINLGLYERESTDIKLFKDLYSAKLSINGFNHVYEYASQLRNYRYDKENASFNVAVQFIKEEGISKYTRPIYVADVNYENADKSKELKTYITYEVTMLNETTNLTTKINSVVDYYDAKYGTTGIKAGTEIDENTKEIKEGSELNIQAIEAYNEKYNKMVIETNSEIEAGKAKKIYVTFELSKEQVREILKGEEAEEPLDNEVEVNSYETLKDGKLYAAIDQDSIPANGKPADDSDKEDDDDKAPSLVLKPENDRTMSGTVFEDKALSEGTGKVREGNGIYDEGENVIKDVIVVMTQVNKDGTEEMKDDKGEVIQYTAKPTDENGNFTITGYTPGYYAITYIWGQNNDVKIYKATVFDTTKHQGTDWYKTETPRYSDAMDDYEQRKDIDNNANLTLMYSKTPVFGVGVDQEGSTEAEITTVSDGNEFIRQDSKSMDFGIIERARQQMEIAKNVDTIKIIGPHGETINDARIDENGNLVGQRSRLTGGPSYGYVRAEIDSEMIQGSTIEIGYKITVKNNSELDYDSESFYHYGTLADPSTYGNIIKLKPEKLYDYLDSKLTIDTNKEENKTWVVKPASEITSEPVTLTEEYFNSLISKDGQSGFTEVASVKLTEIFTQWETEMVESKTVRQVKLADKNVLEKQLSGELEPGQTIEEKIIASTTLTTSNEIKFENHIEIPQVTRTGNTGRRIDVSKSTLYNKAEWVGITGPTGANKDYTMTIIISLSVAIVLGVGIIFIKKKVL